MSCPSSAKKLSRDKATLLAVRKAGHLNMNTKCLRGTRCDWLASKSSGSASQSEHMP